MREYKNIQWSKVKAVVFDVDGTLYHQKSLRLRMGVEMVLYYLRHFTQIRNLRILIEFRRVREELATNNIQDIINLQYEIVANRLNVSSEFVKRLVEEWIIKRPLKHIYTFRYPNVDKLFEFLLNNQIQIAIFSDYPCIEKIMAMKLEASVYCSGHDADINCLKPLNMGLKKILMDLDISPKDCILIGDRDDRDGACARSLDIPFILINVGSKKSGGKFYNLLYQVISTSLRSTVK